MLKKTDYGAAAVALGLVAAGCIANAMIPELIYGRAGSSASGDPVGYYLRLALSVASTAVLLGLVIVGLLRLHRSVNRMLDLKHAAVESATSAILICDTDGTIAYANRSAHDTFGYAPRSLTGRRFEELFRDPPAAAIALAAVKPGRPWRAEIMGRQADGSRFHAGVTVSEAGEDALLCIINDISQRKRAEAAAALDEARLETLLVLSQMTEASDGELAAFALEQAVRLTQSRWGYVILADADGRSGSVYGFCRATAQAQPSGEGPSATCLADLPVWRTMAEAPVAVMENGPGEEGPRGAWCPPSGDTLPRLIVPIVDRGGLVALVDVAGKSAVYEEADIRQVTLLMDGMQRLVARRRDLEALRGSEERLRAVFEAAQDCIFIKDRALRYTHANPATARLLGVPVPGIIGCTCRELEEEADAAREEAEDLRVLAGETVESEQERMTAGVRRTFEILKVPMRDSQGALAGICGIARDITQRKSAEAALRESERRFRELADMLPDAVFEVRTDLSISYANRAAVEMLGYEMHEFTENMSLMKAIAPDELLRVSEALRSTTAESSSVSTLTLTKADGTTVTCEVHTVAMVDGDGGPVGYRGVARDVAERLQAEHTHRLAAVGQLSAGVAHEFNNIMAGMSGRAEYATARGTPESYAKLADTVLSGVSRGAGICRDLMRFASPPEPGQSDVAIQVPIEEALELAATELQRAAVTVVRRYEAGDLLVRGDAGQLQQVFSHLITNACHAMPSGGTLTITARREEGSEPRGRAPQIVVEVADTGTGIAPAAMPHIFDPFYTTKGALGGSTIAGTGLGLSVAHGVVQAHGGTISVRSEVGVGTSFELRLPRHVPAPTYVPVPEPPPARAGGSRRVLLAEDEADLRETICELLRDNGFEVTPTGTTDEALQALQEASFDVIVSDLMMPGGGGQEIIAAARRLSEQPAIIVITGRADGALRRDVEAMGADACLQKPFGLSQVLQAVQTVSV